MNYGIDIIGRIAILRFNYNFKEKKKLAEEILDKNKSLTTVLEKIDRIKGRLRTYKTRYLAGMKTKETIHKESSCYFKLDVEKTYFSPRLGNERLELAKLIKPGKKVLVLFAGIGPFSIIIAKKARPKKVVSVELNRTASKYAEENVLINKLNNIEIIQADVKKLKLKEKFDYIVMPRPQLKDLFLKESLKFAGKGSLIFFYGFGKDAEEILQQINHETKKRKIKILNIKKAGEIGAYTYRWRVDLLMLD